MPCKYVIGQGALLQWALRSWAEIEPETELIPLEIGQEQYSFDLSAVSSLKAPSEATAFVIWNEDFLSFRRLELMGEFKARGYKMPALLCKGALISESVRIGENVSIGAGAVIGPDCQIGMNAHIGQGALLGAKVQVGKSAWVAGGVQMGMGSTLGAHSVIGQGVIVADGVSIGRQAVLAHAGRRTEPLPDKTYLLARLEQEVRIIDYTR